MRLYVNALLDLIYPPRCPSCSKLTEGDFCARCVRLLPAVGNLVCRYCGKPTTAMVDDCRDCRGRRLYFDAARAAWTYEGLARDVIHAYKYANRKSLAPALARYLAPLVEEIDLETRPKTPDAIRGPRKADLALWGKKQTNRGPRKADFALWGGSVEARERMCDYVTEPRRRITRGPRKADLALWGGALQTGFSAAFLITWVPLTRRKTWGRGYNQAKLLATNLAEATGIPAAALLRRTRPTKDQNQLDVSARKTNVKGAFGLIGAQEAAGADIILVDDVYTTGSTVAECSKMLKQSGAASVRVVTLARTVIDG